MVWRITIHATFFECVLLASFAVSISEDMSPVTCLTWRFIWKLTIIAIWIHNSSNLYIKKTCFSISLKSGSLSTFKALSLWIIFFTVFYLVHYCYTVGFGCSINIEFIFTGYTLEWCPVFWNKAIGFVFLNTVQKVVVFGVLKSESRQTCCTWVNIFISCTILCLNLETAILNPHEST